jgi:DNA mismatch endonuclease, patch repair protein
MGLRFRIHRRDLPGCPDIVFPALKKVIFVHGCFWHQHRHCREGRVPTSNQVYWKTKLAKNKKRDALNRRRLTGLGWASMVVWECEIERKTAITSGVAKYLDL